MVYEYAIPNNDSSASQRGALSESRQRRWLAMRGWPMLVLHTVVLQSGVGRRILSTAPTTCDISAQSVQYGYESNSTYGGVIYMAGSLSLQYSNAFGNDEATRYFGYGQQMAHAGQLFATWVNEEKGGIELNGVRYGVDVWFFDDHSTEAGAKAAYCQLFRPGATSEPPAILLGPYSTPLNMVAAETAVETGRLMLGAGAGTPFPFVTNMSFGLSPVLTNSVEQWLKSVVLAADTIDITVGKSGSVWAGDTVSEWAAASPDQDPMVATANSGGVLIEGESTQVRIDYAIPESPCDGSGRSSETCRGSINMGFIVEVGAGGAVNKFTSALCRETASAAAGMNVSVAEVNGSTLTLPVDGTLPQAERLERTREALSELRRANVTVVVGCTYVDVARSICESLQAIDWTPLATMVSQAVTQPSWEQPDAWPGLNTSVGEYALGFTGWYKSRKARGEITNLTSPEFASIFLDQYGVEPTEQAAAQFTAGVLAMTAIERAESLDPPDIARTIRSMNLREFYGDVSFFNHPEPQMNRMDALVVQEPPLGTGPDIVYPPSSTNNAIIFPTVSWATRACRHIGKCMPASLKGLRTGYCDRSGQCACVDGYQRVPDGDFCDVASPTQSTGISQVEVALCIVAGVVAFLVVIAIVVALRLRERSKDAHQRFVLRGLTDAVPPFALPIGCEYHLFLSHSELARREQPVLASSPPPPPPPPSNPHPRPAACPFRARRSMGERAGSGGTAQASAASGAAWHQCAPHPDIPGRGRPAELGPARDVCPAERTGATLPLEGILPV